MSLIKTLTFALTVATASMAVSTAFAADQQHGDSHSSKNTPTLDGGYVYPVMGGVNYNEKSQEWKDAHAFDPRPELAGQNG